MAFSPLVYKGQSSSNSFVAGYLNAAMNNSNYSGNGYSATECTWWAAGRAKNCGFGDSYAHLGNAVQWATNYTGTKIYTWSYSAVEPGDIIVFGLSSSRLNPGHVVFVESVNGNTMTVSEAADSKNHPKWLQVKDVSNWGGGGHWNWSSAGGGEWFVCICKSPGNGSGGELPPEEPPDWKPDDEDEPGEEGHYEMRSYEIDYTGNIYECGIGTFSSQSGTQDAPMAPSEISSSTERLNQRWEPFNMYTYERVMTYDENNNPIWSDWEQKYSGSDIVMLGDQPAYGNGWEMDWGDN